MAKEHVQVLIKGTAHLAEIIACEFFGRHGWAYGDVITVPVANIEEFRQFMADNGWEIWSED